MYPHCTCYLVIAQIPTVQQYITTLTLSLSANIKHLYYTHEHSGLPRLLTTGLYLTNTVALVIIPLNYCNDVEHIDTVQLDDFKCATETISHISLQHTLFITSPLNRFTHSCLYINKVPSQTDFTYAQPLWPPHGVSTIKQFTYYI